MRLHQLQVSAFGPFAETVEVDFDALSEAGLFLLTGPTGAGKTSVLDAVCFALYGDVPGDRGAARRLRSDHAAADAPPRVLLECTLSGRRFRIVRSPSWTRPKKRGVGTTTQPATVTLSERIGGAWTPLSSRLDETGHLISTVLGMNLVQFTQVAMLPQGRFQAFLRAGSDERQRLLQQLFRTGRFESVERWLRERRRELARDSRGHEERVADALSRVSETAGAPLPDPWSGAGLELAASTGEVGGWARDLLDRATDAADRSTSVHAGAETRAGAAEEALRAGRRLEEAQQRSGTARAEHDRLVARGAEMDAVRARVSDARRAAALAGLHEALRETTAAADQATRAATAAVTAAATHLGDRADDETALALAQSAALARAAEIAAELPHERRLAGLRDSLTRDRARLAECSARAAALAERAEEAPGRLVRLRAEHASATQARAGLEAARGRLGSARARLEAATAVPRLSAEADRARQDYVESTDLAQTSKERWLDLQELRISGMAAELAGEIAAGGCCPVCGSAEHPHLARTGAGAPDAAAVKRARRALDDAEIERHARDVALRDARTRLVLAEQAAHGADLDTAREEVASAEADSARLAALVAELPRLTDDLAATEGELRELVSTREALLVETSTLRERVAAQQQEEAAIVCRLAALLADSGCESLDHLQARHQETARACADAVRALHGAAATLEAVTSSAERLERAALQAGFADVAAARASMLAEAEVARLESVLRQHDTALAALRHLLVDPDLTAAAALAAPDLAVLELAHVQAQLRLREAQAGLAVARDREDRLRALVLHTEEALRQWAPVRTDLELVTRLAQLVDGRSPDNTLQMRLSAYVLARRLSQVVAAANARLVRMSDGRYALEHTARRGAGETRGGLSLVVRDDWSGEPRDPATLSGGETFVVSLALALGLADVITQEAGGADLDTLFVDEGFGALDADTLEDVMDTLDSLRDGGRVVGVVSHVPQMAERIPAQLAVAKARDGSRLTLLGCANN